MSREDVTALGVRPRLPRDFSRSGAPIGNAGQHEQKIGETVEVPDYQFGNVGVPTQRDHASLGAPAHRAGEVEGSGLRRAPGKDETPQRIELARTIIDRPFELTNPGVVDLRLLQLLRHFLPVGRGEERANAEQVPLDPDDQLIDAG
jgi:hypothetical protein